MSNELLKIEALKSRIDLANIMSSSGFVSTDWVMKNVLGFNTKSEIRKFKIDRIYGKDNT